MTRAIVKTSRVIPQTVFWLCWPEGHVGPVMFSVVTPYAAGFFAQQGHGTRYAHRPLAQTAPGGATRPRRHFTRHRGESLREHKRIVTKYLGADE
jgi:hypothetical protein